MPASKIHASKLGERTPRIRHLRLNKCCEEFTEFTAIVAMLFVLLRSLPRMQFNRQALGTLMAGMYAFAKLLQLIRQHCRILQ